MARVSSREVANALDYLTWQSAKQEKHTERVQRVAWSIEISYTSARAAWRTSRPMDSDGYASRLPPCL